MNFRRGFFRLWLVLSLAWMVLIFALAGGLTSRPLLWQEIADGWRAEREWTASSEQKALPDFLGPPLEISERISKGHEATALALDVGKMAVIPPLILLALGAVIGWALRGFRRG